MNSDNAQLNYPGDGVFDNSIASGLKSRDDFRMSQTLMNQMLALNDPRLDIYATPTVNFSTGVAGAVKYAGMPNGLLTDSAGKFFNIASRPGLIFYPGPTAYGTLGGNGTKQPMVFLTNEEVQFIKAEAAERSMGGLTPSQAAGFYNAGITASMQRWSTYIGADADQRGPDHDVSRAALGGVQGRHGRSDTDRDAEVHRAVHRRL